jgi:hypothetical protein
MTVTAIKKQDAPSSDLKQSIIDKIGDLSDYQLAPGEVLLVIYQRPEMTAGGIILTPQNLKEDIYQGKSHLVVKIGEGCDFFGLDVRLHDWVVVRPSDGWAIDINPRPNILDRKDYVPCRHVLPKYIRAKIPHPAFVW